jgi:serine/threonine protein kinase
MSTPGKSSASTADQTKDESNSNQGAGQIMIKYEDFSDMTAIGSGSFGKVFRADYLGTDVAVKEFFQKIPDMPDYDFHKYFERELSMLRLVSYN